MLGLLNLLLRRPDLRQEDGSAVAVGEAERLSLEVDVDAAGDGVRDHELRRHLSERKHVKIKRLGKLNGPTY